MIIRGLTMKNGKIVEARGNKFGAEKKRGYDSRGEADYSVQLDILKAAGKIAGYDRQVPVSLDIVDSNGKLHHICNMRVDFLVHHNGQMAPAGTDEFIEYKGFATNEWRLKHKLFCALYPDKHYTIVWHGGKR